MRELYLLETPDQLWMDHGRCATVDPELMITGDPAAAIEVCRWCAVREECAAYADQVGESFGVWGGVDRSTLLR